MSLPGDIKTEPSEMLVFNGPFLKGQKCNIRITNLGSKRIGWSLKSTNVARFSAHPTCGAIEPNKQGVIDMVCQMIKPSDEKGHDRITVEWVDAPTGSKGFQQDWFFGVIRRKIIPIKYNL